MALPQGTRVTHTIYGSGTIRKMSENAEKERYLVDFASGIHDWLDRDEFSVDDSHEDFPTRVESEQPPRFTEGQRVRTPVGNGRVQSYMEGDDPHNEYTPYRAYTVQFPLGDAGAFPEHTLDDASLPRLPLTDILELLDDVIRDHFTNVMANDVGGNVTVSVEYDGSAGGDGFRRVCKASCAYMSDTVGFDMKPVLEEAIRRASFAQRNEVKYLPKYR